jgi:hypothetical protein
MSRPFDQADNRQKTRSAAAGLQAKAVLFYYAQPYHVRREYNIISRSARQ